MRLEDIPKHVLVDLLEGADYTVEEIVQWTPQEVFEKYAEYNGLLGSWGKSLWDTVWELRSKDKPKDPAAQFVALHKDCTHETVFFSRAERKVICHKCMREIPELTAEALKVGPENWRKP